MSRKGIVRRRGAGQAALRLLLYAVLVLFCLVYLLPLVIMVSTSLKSLGEIRTGSLISLPTQVSLDAWLKAWGTACVGVRSTGRAPSVWRSVLRVVPAVLVSPLVGAGNGCALP